MAEHPHVAFAARYADAATTTLDAFSALWRLDSLIDDVEHLEDARNALSGEALSGLPWYGFEVASYYAVGFVTCLEWHARSRLVDLYTYRPDCIKPEDLKGQINEKLLPQMVAANVSAAQLLGAMVTVGSIEKYLSIFARVFKELGIEATPAELVRRDIAESGGESVRGTTPLDEIVELFDYRHRLVHEIDIFKVGPYALRDNLGPKEASRFGKMCRQLMRILEAELTRSAPADFPNLLDAEQLPRDQTQILDAKIGLMEALLESQLEHADQSDRDFWQHALSEADSMMAAHDSFLREAGCIYDRYFDYRRPLMVSLRKARLAFLKELHESLTIEPVIHA